MSGFSSKKRKIEYKEKDKENKRNEIDEDEKNEGDSRKNIVGFAENTFTSISRWILYGTTGDEVV